MPSAHWFDPFVADPSDRHSLHLEYVDSLPAKRLEGWMLARF